MTGDPPHREPDAVPSTDPAAAGDEARHSTNPLPRKEKSTYPPGLARRGRTTQPNPGVSGLHHPQPTAAAGLCVEVPDDWPNLTPSAARAVLHVLVHVARARGDAVVQGGDIR